MSQSRPKVVATRFTDRGYEWIKEVAGRDITMADVIRECVAVAAQHEDELKRRLNLLGRF